MLQAAPGVNSAKSRVDSQTMDRRMKPMKPLLILLTLLAGLAAQPLYADIQLPAADTIMADESGGDGKPPTEEEEPDCE